MNDPNDTGRGPPRTDETQRDRGAHELADDIRDRVRKKMDAVPVPPTNLPQGFLNGMLRAAVLDGQYHTAETLIRYGAQAARSGRNLIPRAAWHGDVRIVRLLHISGARLDPLDRSLASAVEKAERSGDDELADYLRGLVRSAARPEDYRP